MEARLVHRYADRLLRAWEEKPVRSLLLRAIEDSPEAEALDALGIPPEPRLPELRRRTGWFLGVRCRDF